MVGMGRSASRARSSGEERGQIKHNRTLSVTKERHHPHEFPKELSFCRLCAALFAQWLVRLAWVRFGCGRGGTGAVEKLVHRDVEGRRELLYVFERRERGPSLDA